MKKLKQLKDSLQKISVMALMLVASIYANAQDSTNSIVNTTTTTTTEEWYANPLYLVIGGLVLIIIIALIARGNSKKS